MTWLSRLLFPFFFLFPSIIAMIITTQLFTHLPVKMSNAIGKFFLHHSNFFLLPPNQTSNSVKSTFLDWRQSIQLLKNIYDKLYHSLYNFFLSHFFKRNVTKIYSQATFFMYYLSKTDCEYAKKRARNLLKYDPLTTCHTKCHINTTTNFKLPWHDMYISALKVANNLSKNPVSSPCQENVLNSLNTHQNPLQINFSFAKMSQHRHPPLLKKMQLSREKNLLIPMERLKMDVMLKS